MRSLLSAFSSLKGTTNDGAGQFIAAVTKGMCARMHAQVFYGILVQHFANLAGGVPWPLPHLDALLPHLLDLTAEVPFYAATVARARLNWLQQRLSAALTDPVRFPACRTVLRIGLRGRRPCGNRQVRGVFRQELCRCNMSAGRCRVMGMSHQILSAARLSCLRKTPWLVANLL